MPLGGYGFGGAEGGVARGEEAPAGKGPIGIDPAKPFLQEGAGGAASEEAAWEVRLVFSLGEEGEAPRALLQDPAPLRPREVGEEGFPLEAGKGDEPEATGEAPRPAGGLLALFRQVVGEVQVQGAPGFLRGHRRKR
jgi:hypothetical protein